MSDTTPDAGAWAGWHRPHAAAPWRPVLTAATEAAAWARLLARPLRGDLLVTAAGTDPNRQAARRRRG
jgi:hypothetical protein